MRLFLLVITLMFAFSALADCCNYEMESAQDDVCQSISADNHCDDATGTTEEDHHCHCNVTTHLKLLRSSSSYVLVPSFSESDSFPKFQNNLQSSYSASIFHPPIA